MKINTHLLGRRSEGGREVRIEEGGGGERERVREEGGGEAGEKHC